jgi:hypothetical protein
MERLSPDMEIPKDGTVSRIVETRFIDVRWEPYKPKSREAKRGLSGRWQARNKRGVWVTVSFDKGRCLREVLPYQYELSQVHLLEQFPLKLSRRI